MLEMNPILAELYNTAENIGVADQGEDTEKLAQAQILDQMFEAEGINIDDLAPETILKVANTIFGENNAISQAAEPAVDDAQEKLAEADLIGRVMAHSFVDEKAAIQKEAGKLQAVGGAISGAGKRVLEAVKASPERYRQAGRSFRLATSRGMTGEGAALKQRLKEFGTAAKKVAPEAAIGSLGAAAGTAAAMKGKKDGYKTASALDILAEQRAVNMLKEAGYSTEEEPTGEDKLAFAVEQRALEMLQAAGYPVE